MTNHCTRSVWQTHAFKNLLATSPLSPWGMWGWWRTIKGVRFLVEGSTHLEKTGQDQNSLACEILTSSRTGMAGFNLECRLWLVGSGCLRSWGDSKGKVSWLLVTSPGAGRKYMTYILYIFYFCSRSMRTSLSQNLTLPCDDSPWQDCQI